ncbi:class I SAM-dependent methyltransferase [Chitinophaga ginsengisegetis]|uniref:class I SAM-dependent methyltransferase n=1 Tax=Chitinophaga ginsengisegetis TaxID=393003 RepID=UPI000DB95331|nr:class I SAM-dependent methyltransferase [Chitinophaga ginsengisegetis]MDR6569982.1 ubiquinone/menaquinone biosynthesis C-methylase UbiE [Chitinophaga ginsengisegetis]MDR6649715.1 ubiquinone/menaquinone biosynthesis C-methylase UbiE [Chitinophaga ginsengisegetis]MDR6656082.1 ubiquinone/menaquinone biosynthesis C-methylase UbiE [Chitinophaga ginsengisegetis]
MNKEVYKITGNDASNYEEHLGPLIFEPSAKALLPHIVTLPAQSILEIASGTGRLTKHLRENFPAATSITATDINPDMLELAQQQLGHSAITFQLADAQALPFADQSFDMIVNQFGLMFLPDKQGGVNEAYRVLKPGGHFVFTTWDHTASMGLFKLLIDEIMIPLFEGEDTSRFHTPFALHDPNLLNTYLKQAGFAHHKAVYLKFKGHANSPKHIVTSYFHQHPLGRQVKEKAPADYDRVANELEQQLIQRFGPGAFEFELSALAGIGQK